MSKKNETKHDIRIIKTQAALSAALLTLLEKTAFQKITVNDICTRAMVSRATFYTHFEDKYHLLRFSLKRLKFQMEEQIECDDYQQMITLLIINIEKRAKMFRNLLLNELDYELMKMLNDLTLKDFINEMEKRINTEELTVPLPVQASFYTGGMSSLLLHWIDGTITATTEEMTQYFLKFNEWLQ